MILPTVLLLLAAANCYRLSQKENELLQKSCGVANMGSLSTFKLFGGRPIKPGEYPFMIKIFHRLERPGSYLLCTGSLISPRHVLTATHCTTSLDETAVRRSCDGVLKNYSLPASKPTHFHLYVGTRCNPPEECSRETYVSKVFTDKKLNLCTRKVQKGELYEYLVTHDLAILELDKEVSSKDAIPICLPHRELPLAKELQVAGNGLESSSSGQKYQYKIATIPFSTEDRHEVIVGRSNSTFTCRGDSGGPLLQLNNEGRYVVVGVTSQTLDFLIVDCEKPVDMIFADVRKSIDWICQITGVCPDGEPPKKQDGQELLEGLKKLIAKIGNAGRDVVEKIRDFLEKAMKLIQG